MHRRLASLVLVSSALFTEVADAQTAAPAASFNRVAAAAALDRDYDACLTADPDRTLRIVVEWAPSGKVASVVSEGASGASPLEQCLAGVLRNVTIPAFARPSSVKVKKLVQRSDCVKVVIDSKTPIAVDVDGKPVGMTPVTVRVRRGNHLVTWMTTDGKTVSRSMKTATCGSTLVNVWSSVEPAGPPGP
jgi:hypothetical protein